MASSVTSPAGILSVFRRSLACTVGKIQWRSLLVQKIGHVWIVDYVHQRFAKGVADAQACVVGKEQPDMIHSAFVTTQIVQPGSLWYPEGFRSPCLPYARWAGRSPSVRLVSLQG